MRKSNNRRTGRLKDIRNLKINHKGLFVLNLFLTQEMDCVLCLRIIFYDDVSDYLIRVLIGTDWDIDLVSC